MPRNFGLSRGTSDDALDAAWEQHQRELAAELPPDAPPSDEEIEEMAAYFGEEGRSATDEGTDILLAAEREVAAEMDAAYAEEEALRMEGWIDG